ncbi:MULTISPECIES: TetR/AcrR family transcriptional regulator [Actinokineospora]|uniref:TetR/AcrR family transcriptional regulator n=1 Tax=Actinokineospora TaxID=39845 RepID=UPI001E38E22F|nr:MULTISPECIES: TetR/AcrR family transcriptional regulator [Actinokineospora]
MAEKPMRADAARNRARLLEVAYETFAAEGISVPVDEIARRAGVGPGTLYRHFPTKEALFQAIVAHRLDQMAEQGRELSQTAAPGEALFRFIGRVVEEGSSDQGLVEAMADTGPTGVEERFIAMLGELVERAKQAGQIRADVTVRDVKTLLVGCQAMQRYSKDPETTERVLDVVRSGLAATSARDH